MVLSLEGKTALITGGSKGIGFAIAKTYIEAGARVMLVARKAEALKAAATELGGPDKALWMTGNVGKPEDAAAAVAATIEQMGGLDVLVNNAATNPWAGPTIDIDLPRWDKTMEVNLRGPLVWTQEAWRQTMKQNGGAIINVASVGAFVTSPALGTYGVAKSALVYLTKQLAAELAPKVRVNCVAPGLIKTDFAEYLWKDGKDAMVAKAYPLKRLGEPEDVAEAVLYFTAGASWVTGQTLILDGGGIIRFTDTHVDNG